MNTNPSICIAKVDKNITKQFIFNVLNKHQLGNIRLINLVPIGKFQRAFIHFHYWYNNEKSLKVKNLLLTNKDFKIIYVHPGLWKCSIVYN